jgi:hypothetical protein
MNDFIGPDIAAKGGEGTEPGDPQLPELLRQLANSRQVLQLAIERKERFLANPDYQKILDDIEDAKDMVKVGEKIVRKVGMDYYQATGDKNPHVKIGIKEVTVCRYEIPTAEEWCRINLPQAFDWNQHFFEKHAIAVEKTAPIPFVEIVKDPICTIAQDLSGLIPTMDEVPF